MPLLDSTFMKLEIELTSLVASFGEKFILQQGQSLM